MIVLHALEEAIGRFSNPVVAVGNFDGVHLGHRAIIDEAVSRAKMLGRDCLVVTFDPHPQLVLGRKSSGFLLTPLDEKLKMLSEHSVSGVLVLRFDGEFSATEPEQFVKDVYVQGLHISELVVGFSHAFGRCGRGNADLLYALGVKLGFRVRILPPYQAEDRVVGSSLIRTAVTSGEIGIATRLLGHTYTVTGRVIRGEGRGRQIQFPTANLELIDKYQLLPKHGVYAVKVEIEGINYDGVMNVGVRPTFGIAEERCEIHILDFNRDLYGRTIRNSVIQRIRDEEKFSGIEELSRNIARDVQKARELLS
ncbi:MAG: bifunctional riboflavin kinase/FAD synthetase [Gemmatimonadota bacterium]|nr:bifunctional riboflavin kinase/FAD synthetase [Gemmatimonadota bacterium]